MEKILLWDKKELKFVLIKIKKDYLLLPILNFNINKTSSQELEKLKHQRKNAPLHKNRF